MDNNTTAQSYNLNVSGGNKFAQYFVSLGYTNEKGLFKTNSNNDYNTNLNFNRYFISSRVNINITDDFTADVTMMGRVEEGNQPGGSGNGYSVFIVKYIYNSLIALILLEILMELLFSVFFLISPIIKEQK